MDKFEAEMRRWEAEELILSMADIVYENRRLRRELEEARHYEEKYSNLLNESYKNAQENTACLLKAIVEGVFDK